MMYFLKKNGKTQMMNIILAFTLSYPTPLEAKEEIESALALAKRASTFSKDKESLKIALYKQALSLIPESNNSLKAIKLRKDIQRKLSLLETK